MADALDRLLADRQFALWLLIALTGQRRSESLGIGWDTLDLDQAELEIRRKVTIGPDRQALLKDNTKTEGSHRKIGLPDSLVAALRDHRRRQAAERLAFGPGYGDPRYPHVPLVFTEEDGRLWQPNRLSKVWEALLKRLDLPPIGLHAFGRHGAVTNAAGAGIDIAFIMRLTGHATREMVDHYTHLGGQQPHRGRGPGAGLRPAPPRSGRPGWRRGGNALGTLACVGQNSE